MQHVQSAHHISQVLEDAFSGHKVSIEKWTPHKIYVHDHFYDFHLSARAHFTCTSISLRFESERILVLQIILFSFLYSQLQFFYVLFLIIVLCYQFCFQQC